MCTVYVGIFAGHCLDSLSKKKKVKSAPKGRNRKETRNKRAVQLTQLVYPRLEYSRRDPSLRYLQICATATAQQELARTNVVLCCLNQSAGKIRHLNFQLPVSCDREPLAPGSAQALGVRTGGSRDHEESFRPK